MGIVTLALAAATAAVAGPDSRSLIGCVNTPIGMEWRSISVTAASPDYVDCRTREAARYGAVGDEHRRVYARIGHTTISYSPWTVIESRGLQNLEHLRVEWLRREGYTGGVRTFRKDSSSAPEGEPSASAEPQPAREKFEMQPIMVIPIPEGARRTPRYRVHAPNSFDGAVFVSSPGVRYSIGNYGYDCGARTSCVASFRR